MIISHTNISPFKVLFHTYQTFLVEFLLHIVFGFMLDFCIGQVLGTGEWRHVGMGMGAFYRDVE